MVNLKDYDIPELESHKFGIKLIPNKSLISTCTYR